VDPNLPEAFDLKYVGEDNAEHRPIMLHRAILGSLERFIGVYLEHTAGHLPAWLAPVQVQILNITDRVNPFCEQIEKTLKSRGVRVEFDRRNEKLNFKIREAQVMKVPFMIVVGDREAENQQVSLRLRTGQQLNAVGVDQVIEEIVKHISQREINFEMNKGTNQEVSH
jgi:threonyl-tRNA synthetase